jgi:hypothetical protein
LELVDHSLIARQVQISAEVFADFGFFVLKSRARTARIRSVRIEIAWYPALVASANLGTLQLRLDFGGRTSAAATPAARRIALFQKRTQQQKNSDRDNRESGDGLNGGGHFKRK